MWRTRRTCLYVRRFTNAVGYESPSQFSREYRRQFGKPPMRDVETCKDRAFAAALL
jgi:transcriptional regulator GlxA family with amidase domain